MRPKDLEGFGPVGTNAPCHLPAGEVFVIVGFYLDRSGAKLLGIYDSLEQAQDRAELCTAAGAVFQVRVVQMPLNRQSPQEIFS